MKPFKTFVFLLILFLISVFIRLPFLTNKVECFDNQYINTLTSLENWKQNGLSVYYFSPVQTYNNPGDKFITYYKRLEDKKGNNYYVSFPPFTFLFAHFFLKTFNIYPTKLPLQIINLFLHLLSAFFIYLIICNLYNKNFKSLFLPAIIAYTVYVFMPVMLYIHTSVYFPEMFGQVIWITGIFFTLKLFKNINYISTKNFLLIGSILFFMIYTEWIGVFCAFTIALICFLKRKKNIKYIILFRTVIISSVLSLLLIFVQYSSINGIENMIHSLALRFLERSGLFAAKYSDMGINIYSFSSYIHFLKNINRALIGFGYLLIIIFIILLSLKKIKNRINLSNKYTLLLLLSVLPVIIHWFVFFNANAIHYLLMGRLAVPVSLCIGIISYKLINLSSVNHQKSVKFCLITVIIFISAISVIIFKKDMKNTCDNSFLSNAINIIKSNSKNDEVIFIKTNDNSLQDIIYLSFQTKRNMDRAKNITDAKNKIKQSGKCLTKGVFYDFDQPLNTNKIYHFKVKLKDD